MDQDVRLGVFSFKSRAGGQKMITARDSPVGRTAKVALKLRSPVGSLCRTCAWTEHNILSVPRLRPDPHFRGEIC
jgi:hypothetical protein